MSASLRQTLGRLAAALITWTVVFTLTVGAINDPRHLNTTIAPLATPAIILQLAYLVAMLALTLRKRMDALSYVLSATQLLLALWLGVLLPFDWLQIYTIIWIAILPSVVPSARIAWGLLGAVVLTWYLIGEFVWQESDALRDALLFGTFHLFALVSARETLAARLARDAADTANRELRGTRQLLAESSRAAERARIARDLHDMLGHHLTALSINLQVASRTADGDQRERLEHCHALARLLLSDVRETVGELRADPGLDLSQALQSVTEHTPGLTVHLDVPSPFPVDDVATASTLLRTVQEATTNTLRHAQAQHSWIRLRREPDHLHLQIHDDGRVKGELQPGNGLKGMRERALALAGNLQFATRDNAVHLDLRLPLDPVPQAGA
ncbi:MAG: histidine kinase [Pseudomonadota bacterium]